MEAGSLSRNVGTDLFLRRGAQTAVYRAQFAPGQMGSAGMLNARTAQVSGTAMMTTQAAGLIDAAQAGQLDLTDFSLFSPTWDVMLFGAGLAPVALGTAARFNHEAAASRTSSEADDPGFTIRATPARMEALAVARQTQHDLFYTRTRLTLREKFGQWLPPDGDAISRSVVRLNDSDFNGKFMAMAGKTGEEAAQIEGFYHRPTSTVYMRESAEGSFNPVVSSKSIKDFNSIGKSIRSQSIEVPYYLWERDSQTGRWMQVAGAANMAAASGNLGAFVDPGVWGPTDMGFVIADGLIAVGTGGTAFMAAKTKNGVPLSRRSKRAEKIFAAFQMTSASALAWEGLGHLLARGGVMGPDIQSTDIHQIGS